MYTINDENQVIHKNYSKLDGFLAIILFITAMLFLYIATIFYINKGIYLGFFYNVFLTAIVIAFVIIRKQKFDSIGITKKNLLKSILVGLICSIICILFKPNTGSAVVSGRFLMNLPTFEGIFFYFIVVGLNEEIAFRGFVQTRIYGLIKSDFIAILLVGIMFVLIHIPFKSALANMGFMEYINANNGSILAWFMFHVFSNFLCRKLNSIVAPVIFHGFVNLSGSFL